MSRTTAALVRGIIDAPTTDDLDPFIAIANELVTEKCADVESYGTARLELIERWLSAHFYTVYSPRTTQEKAGSVGETYQSKVDLGLNSSHYGQTAMRLDTNGGLAALDASTKKGGKKTVGVTYVGTTTQAQEDAYDLT